jgi:cyclic pyranopterin phosphate synthase
MSMGLVTLFYKNLTLALCAGLTLREALDYRVYYEWLHAFSASIFIKEQKTKLRIYNGYQKREKAETQRQLLDRYNRAITSLRIAVTEEQNLTPLYGRPKSASGKAQEKDLLTSAEIYRLSRIACSLGIEKIRVTGGEPLLREGIVELIEYLSSLTALKELSLATDGILLANYVRPLKKAGLERVSITLDTLKEGKFRSISGGRELARVIGGIEKAKGAGLTVKANVVVLKGINDDELEDFIRFGKEYGVTVRLIEYMPISLTTKWEHHFISREEIVEKLSSLINAKVYPHGKEGTPSKYFHLSQGGEAGVISPVSHGMCHNCDRLRLTADGILKSCLTHESTVDLKTALREHTGDEEITALFERAVLLKPEQGVYTLREEILGRTGGRR